MESDEGEIRGQKEITDHIVSFYKNLFGQSETCSIRLSDVFWPDDMKLNENEVSNSIEPFRVEEVKNAVMDMKMNSALGSNGYTVAFFQKFWDTIQGDLMCMFQDFWEEQLDIKRLNYGVIILVPKVKEANSIRQYRPICLLNVDFKCFTKVLTNSLVPITQRVIRENQTGFIKGRNILEGVVILHEVIHELQTTKQKGLILKIDFEKAYDRVRWTFLEQVMIGKGFPSTWVNWVMNTVRGGQVCINVNGERSAYFKTFRGLRQGDPLAPLLFNLVADVLGILLSKAINKGHLRGVLNNLLAGGISHIQYADDTVIMIDGSEQSIRTLKLNLYCFEWLTGLKINYHKSEVYVFWVKQEEKERLANMLNCVLGVMPMKYLGIPVSDKHLNISAFSFLPKKLHKRLDPWKGKFLTSGGRQILTNSCLSSIPLYCMGVYWLQDGVHCKMDSIRANFLWQGTEDRFRYHMAKWEMVCRPKDQGGLGIINTRLMNDCLLVKWIWKIF